MPMNYVARALEVAAERHDRPVAAQNRRSDLVAAAGIGKMHRRDAGIRP